MDAITLLKDDHKTVEKLFKQFEKNPGSGREKKQLVKKIVEELVAHAFIEEEIFYPNARAAVPETNDHVLESIEEHHVFDWILSELTQLSPSDERFDAKVSVLMENVRHHVKEEEQEWFPEIRKAMPRRQLQELGEQMEAAKKRAPRDPLALRSASDKGAKPPKQTSK